MVGCSAALRRRLLSLIGWRSPIGHRVPFAQVALLFLVDMNVAPPLAVKPSGKPPKAKSAPLDCDTWPTPSDPLSTLPTSPDSVPPATAKPPARMPSTSKPRSPAKPRKASKPDKARGKGKGEKSETKLASFPPKKSEGDGATNAASTVTNKPVTNRAGNWRLTDPEGYRTYQRELMRKRRAATRSGSTARLETSSRV